MRPANASASKTSKDREKACEMLRARLDKQNMTKRQSTAHFFRCVQNGSLGSVAGAAFGGDILPFSIIVITMITFIVGLSFLSRFFVPPTTKSQRGHCKSPSIVFPLLATGRIVQLYLWSVSLLLSLARKKNSKAPAGWRRKCDVWLGSSARSFFNIS